MADRSWARGAGGADRRRKALVGGGRGGGRGGSPGSRPIYGVAMATIKEFKECVYHFDGTNMEKAERIGIIMLTI